MTAPETQEKDPATVLAEERTRLALKRTTLAGDRTLLAWIRTSISLMTFGFTTHKFFQYLEQSGLAKEGWQAVGPRRFGLVLIGIATVLLISQAWQYFIVLKRMSEAKQKPMPKSPSLIAALVISALGLVAFASILLGGEG